MVIFILEIRSKRLEIELSSLCSFRKIIVSTNNINFASQGEQKILYNTNFTVLQFCLNNKSGDLIIPDSVQTIGENAFLGCTSLTSITIGMNVTTIEESAFNDCTSLTSFSVDANNTHYSINNDVLYNYDQKVLIRCPLGKESNTYKIPDSVETIGDRAFQNCSNLSGNLTIPNSVQTIGIYAFEFCREFTSLIFEAGSQLTTIGNYAFRYCEGFTGDLTIPDSVETIGFGAFSYCEGFTGNLIIPNSVQMIGYEAFQYCSGFAGNLYIGNSVETIEYNAFIIADLMVIFILELQ